MGNGYRDLFTDNLLFIGYVLSGLGGHMPVGKDIKGSFQLTGKFNLQQTSGILGGFLNQTSCLFVHNLTVSDAFFTAQVSPEIHHPDTGATRLPGD